MESNARRTSRACSDMNSEFSLFDSPNQFRRLSRSRRWLACHFPRIRKVLRLSADLHQIAWPIRTQNVTESSFADSEIIEAAHKDFPQAGGLKISTEATAEDEDQLVLQALRHLPLAILTIDLPDSKLIIELYPQPPKGLCLCIANASDPNVTRSR
jgi:hypothetical protein